MASIFTRIIQGEIPCHKIAESEKYFAFLDIRPVKLGHTLVIPKTEVDYLFDLEDDELGDMMIFAKKVAKAVKAVVPCKKVGVAVVGLEVAHAHIHLIPVDQVADLSFGNPLSLSQEELAELAAAIREKGVF
ncbi:MAG TPA: HIT family protein [Flavilitoribacter sp.]|nr:HIT family protein [Flavilitoribacter sp.]HMQ88576.1 HIT family protein [Flavilitoribacter sp.]